MKINKTVSLDSISKHKEAISNLKGDESIQVITESEAGETSVKVIITQEQYVELLNSKSNSSIPNEIMDKVKTFEGLAKKVVKVVDALQEDFKKKK